jgi:hypothetical protein
MSRDTLTTAWVTPVGDPDHDITVEVHNAATGITFTQWHQIDTLFADQTANSLFDQYEDSDLSEDEPLPEGEGGDQVFTGRMLDWFVERLVTLAEAANDGLGLSWTLKDGSTLNAYSVFEYEDLTDWDRLTLAIEVANKVPAFKDAARIAFVDDLTMVPTI